MTSDFVGVFTAKINLAGLAGYSGKKSNWQGSVHKKKGGE